MALLKPKYLQIVNPVYVGDRLASEMKLSILTYDSTSAEIKNVSTIDELIKLKCDSKMSWINVSGFKDIDSITRLCEFLGIHPLTIEDIMHTEQQAKMEIFEGYRFLSMKSIQHQKINADIDNERSTAQDDEGSELVINQVSMIIMKDVILTFQELSRGAFDSIRKALLKDTSEIRKMEIDYLAYLIIDTVINEYFHTIGNLEEYIEVFEDRVIQTNDNRYIEQIQEAKKHFSQIKRAILPLKDNMLSISRHETFFQTGEIKPYIQDLNDKLSNAVSMIEHCREWMSNIMDVNLAVVSYQMNNVMKVLAMISAIAIPLTVITGIYGMNFEFMPELSHKMAYPMVLGVMGLVVIVMIAFFKIRRWF